MRWIFTLIFFFTLPSFALAASITERTAGFILLDVEQHGEAWYVDPVGLRRYYLKDGNAAMQIMSDLGLGITNRDLEQIPVAASGEVGSWPMRQRLAGRILLQVEAHGEAWYVDPVSLERYYLGRPADAYEIMRFRSLGITSADLARISIAKITSDSEENFYLPLTFTAQAPLGNWSDPRQQDACEEASVFMAVKWAQGESFTLAEARDIFIAMSDWEKSQWGYFEDTSINDTAERLMKTYLNFNNFEVKRNVSVDDILAALENNHLVIVAVNGQTIGNPHYTGAGPLRHMIVINGYDVASDEFIVKDPGTIYGNDQRFPKDVLMASLRDYESGNHEPVGNLGTAMIEVWK